MNYTNKLLGYNNVKTVKGEKKNYKTFILYLSAYKNNSKGINLCSHASKGCAESCLVSSGNARFEGVKNGRINKTEYFLSDRLGFLNRLRVEIEKNKNKYTDMILAIRLNGTSDIRWEKFKVFENNTKNIFEVFPDVQFYDYTKNHLRFNNELPSNYHLTFSKSEDNTEKCFELLNRGYNVAMVFNKLPKEYKGFEVINGDEDDLRFNDKRGVIVGLKYKNLTGKGVDNKIAFKSGFAIDIIKEGLDEYNGILNNIKKKVKKNKKDLELIK